MEPNILLERVLSAVPVGNGDVPLNTSHRTGIQAMRLADDPFVGDEEKARALLFLYFGRPDGRTGRLALPDAVAENPQLGVEAALAFFNLNEPRPPEVPGTRPAAGTRVFDRDWDAARVAADFQREYGLDLTDRGLRLHWWRFWSLLRGLSEASLSRCRPSGVRGAVPDEKKMGREAVETLMRRKAALMLPARTEEEAMQLHQPALSLGTRSVATWQ